MSGYDYFTVASSESLLLPGKIIISTYWHMLLDGVRPSQTMLDAPQRLIQIHEEAAPRKMQIVDRFGGYCTHAGTPHPAS